VTLTDSNGNMDVINENLESSYAYIEIRFMLSFKDTIKHAS